MTQSFILSMDSCLLNLLFAFVLLVVVPLGGANDVSFDKNYNVTWGYDHILLLDHGREIQLTLDKSSGSGFRSKLNYGSGFFEMRMKIPKKDSTGVVTSFYLTSSTKNEPTGNHDELDFEVLGGNKPPYTLQTNVFSKDEGGREQRFNLWFDPTKDFHTYQILWNQNQVVLYVDNIPITVFKNNTKIGVNFPSQTMHIESSIWNGEGWASGGKKTNWSQAPFKAYYHGFDINGCQSQNSKTHHCHSHNLWWNGDQYMKLDPDQQRAYEDVRKRYLYYDYCSDKSKSRAPECDSNQ